MAYATGTATSYQDLWDKLLAFLTSNSTLVAAGQAWTIGWSASGANDRVLVGPGLSGADEVLVGLRHVEDAANDSYYFEIRGMAGIQTSATSLSGHSVVSKPKRMFVDAGSMQYWFVANGRRFVVVVRISTVFETMYGGLFLPYAAPTVYPYPMFIGGSAGDVMADTMSWRADADGHSHFPFSHVTFTGNNPTNERSAVMLDIGGSWRDVSVPISLTSTPTSDIAVGPMWFFETSSAILSSTNSKPGYKSLRERMREGFGGTYALTPLTLMQSNPDDQTFGVLDGCYEISGFGNSSENLISIRGVDHLVVQNTFRTTRDQYWALTLE